MQKNKLLMNRLFITYSFLMVFLTLAQGQLLLNRSSQQIEDELLFNRSFLLHNNIKSISAEYMVKKDWQGLSNFGDKVQYRFDESGNLVYKKEASLIANKWETTEFSYLYDRDNKLIEESSRRKEGYWVKEYKYSNVSGNVIEVVNYLVGVEPENNKRVELNRQVFKWETLNDSTIQKSIANNYGLPYLVITYQYDSAGKYMKSEKHHFVVTGEKKEIVYSYNKFGWLESVNSGGKISSFLYDEYGNVIEVSQMEGGRQVKHVEYLYKVNGLLEAQLKTENESSTIHILKYRIEHFID